MKSKDNFDLPQPGVIPIRPMPLDDILKILGSDVKCIETDIDPANISDIALDLVCEAERLDSKRRRVAVARKALRLDANCSDAWLILSDESDAMDEAIELCRKAIKAAETTLGPGFIKEYKPHFGGFHETRPYMRAREKLASLLLDNDQVEEAVQHYSDLLDLNPNDNQGIRDLIVPSLIELSRDAEAMKILNQYKEPFAGNLYSRLLLSFRSSGDSKKTFNAYKVAFEHNPFVVPFLVGAIELPEEEPTMYELGSEEEAIMYVYRGIHSWVKTPGAIEWLGSLFVDLIKNVTEKMPEK